MEKHTPSRQHDHRQKQYDEVKSKTKITNAHHKERPRLGVFAEPKIYYKHNGHARYI